MLEVNGNIADLEAKLEAMGAAAADLTDVWPEIGQWWAARQKTVFATGNRGAWEMRAPSTKPGGRGVLMRSGALMKAVSNPKPISPTPTSARFGAQGSAGWYGVFHQRGDGVPKRQPVPPITSAEGEEVVRIIAEHILEAK